MIASLIQIDAKCPLHLLGLIRQSTTKVNHFRIKENRLRTKYIVSSSIIALIKYRPLILSLLLTGFQPSLQLMLIAIKIVEIIKSQHRIKYTLHALIRRVDVESC